MYCELDWYFYRTEKKKELNQSKVQRFTCMCLNVTFLSALILVQVKQLRSDQSVIVTRPQAVGMPSTVVQVTYPIQSQFLQWTTIALHVNTKRLLHLRL
jgi:hypothetical protein